MALSRVFEPIQIRHLEVANRIVSAAHGTSFSSPPRLIGGDDLVAYHVARAKGGVGLSILEAMAVHPSSQAMSISDDRTVERYREIMQALRPYGTRVFQQLFHIGNIQYNTAGGGIPWSVSTVPSLTGLTGHPMTGPEIEELVAAFATAARRCRDGGLDGVELHCAHGTLPFAFLSSLYNNRTDGYGGALENRMRFVREILTAIREAVGDEFVVGIRLGASEIPGNVNEPELRTVIETLQDEGLIDYLMTSLGDFYRPVMITAGMEAPSGYQLPSSGQLTSAASVPTVVTGRLRTLDEAEQVLADGAADMVSMVRALIADPDLVRKGREGRSQEARPCIACNQGCMAAVLNNPPRMACSVNPVVGFERTLSEDLITRTDSPQRVLVVGGGPAGLEAARVAALAGHHVTLAEGSSTLGGALDVGRRAPRYAPLGDIVDWLADAVHRAGVEVKLGAHLSPDDVLADDADAVIVATGSTPRLDGFQPARPFERARGVELAHVRSSVQLLTGGLPDGAKTGLVLDTVGHFEAVAVAEYLIDHGLAVTFVTTLQSFGGIPVQATFREASALEFLHRGDFTVLARHYLSEITRESCVVSPLYSSRTREVAADVVVLVTQNEPNRAIFDALLAAGRSNIAIVGDAASPRDLTFAMAEGHRAARAIATPSRAAQASRPPLAAR